MNREGVRSRIVHSEWVRRWGAFLSILLDPWVLAIAIVAFLIGRSAVAQADRSTAAVLTLLLSVFAGVLGGIVANRWSRIVDEQVIVTRGKVAVRSLMLLLAGIAALERRACRYLDQLRDEVFRAKVNDEGIATYLEEVVGRCEVLEEEALSSIENWTDIVPEADIRTQIGLITDLKAEIASRTDELGQLRQQVEEVKGQSADKEKALRAEISEKEKALRRTQQELAAKSYQGGLVFGSGSTGGLLSSGPTGPVTISMGPPRCRNCGYEPPDYKPGTTYYHCPKCGSGLVY